MALKLWGLPHEFLILLLVAKAHNPFNTDAVVPGTVKKDHLARCGEPLDIALKIPLPLFSFRGLFQGHHTSTARIQMLHETFDGSAFTGGIASIEDDNQALPGVFDPSLQLE